MLSRETRDNIHFPIYADTTPPCSSESFSEIQPEPNTLNRFSAQTHRCESGVVILLREISGAEREWALCHDGGR
jgi:hypothetical protein